MYRILKRQCKFCCTYIDDVVGVHNGPLPGFNDPIFDAFFGRRPIQPDQGDDEENEGGPTAEDDSFERCGLLCTVLRGICL